MATTGHVDRRTLDGYVEAGSSWGIRPVGIWDCESGPHDRAIVVVTTAEIDCCYLLLAFS